MKRVLIMEDNLSLCLDWKAAFELNHCHVEITHSGEDAVGFLEQQTFDLIVLDVFVPGAKGGLYVLGKLLLMEQQPPCITVTGAHAHHGPFSQKFGENTYLRQAERLGASATLRKPFVAAELVAAASTLWSEATAPGGHSEINGHNKHSQRGLND